MKRIIIFSTFILLTAVSYSQQQVYKMKATSYSIIYFDKEQDYEFSSPWKDTSFIIVINLNNKQLSMYGDPVKNFDLVTTATEYKDDFISFLKWPTAIDDKGLRTHIRLMTIENTETYVKAYYLFIEYLDVYYEYQVVFE